MKLLEARRILAAKFAECHGTVFNFEFSRGLTSRGSFP